jgi:hypothetical protein
VRLARPRLHRFTSALRSRCTSATRMGRLRARFAVRERLYRGQTIPPRNSFGGCQLDEIQERCSRQADGGRCCFGSTTRAARGFRGSCPCSERFCGIRARLGLGAVPVPRHDLSSDEIEKASGAHDHGFLGCGGCAFAPRRSPRPVHGNGDPQGEAPQGSRPGRRLDDETRSGGRARQRERSRPGRQPR